MAGFESAKVGLFGSTSCLVACHVTSFARKPSSPPFCCFQQTTTTITYASPMPHLPSTIVPVTLPPLRDDSHPNFVRYLHVGIHDRRSPSPYIFYRSHTPITVYSHPATPMHPSGKILTTAHHFLKNTTTITYLSSRS